MRLYHFTCSHCIAGVASEGLTEGSLLWMPAFSKKNLRMDSGWQWLTQEPDPKRQAWAKRFMLDCDREEWRLTIVVPFDVMPRLVRWTHLRSILPANQEWLSGFERPGSEAWFLFRGAIPATWIARIDRSAVEVPREDALRSI